MFQPHTLLVTGGAGFIGANFIRYVLNTQAVNIINLDKLTYAGSLQNLQNLPNAKQHMFIQGDITDAELVNHIFSHYKVDTVIHFAAESHVDRSIVEPSTFVKTNILGTYTLLEAARNYWQSKTWGTQPCRFHQISTDEVFGSLNAQQSAFTENDPYKPRSPYSASKASADHLVNAYYHTYGLPITISNCSNNYGPYQHAEKFIPTIIRSCFQNQAVPIYGNGKNVRDWLYVEDHCQGIWYSLTKGEVGKSYNLGGEYEIDNLSLAKHICQEMDLLFPEKAPHEKLLTFVVDRLGHDFRYAMDINLSKLQLQWQPCTDFAAGIKKTIAFYIEQWHKNSDYLDPR